MKDFFLFHVLSNFMKAKAQKESKIIENPATAKAKNWNSIKKKIPMCIRSDSRWKKASSLQAHFTFPSWILTLRLRHTKQFSCRVRRWKWFFFASLTTHSSNENERSSQKDKRMEKLANHHEASNSSRKKSFRKNLWGYYLNYRFSLVADAMASFPSIISACVVLYLIIIPYGTERGKFNDAWWCKNFVKLNWKLLWKFFLTFLTLLPQPE